MIPPLSKKRARQNREYLKLRDQFLADHTVCQVCAIRWAVSVHHKAGRIGKRLTDVSLFLAVCNWCHDKIELNPLWAKEKGYSLSRLAK